MYKWKIVTGAREMSRENMGFIPVKGMFLEMMVEKRGAFVNKIIVIKVTRVQYVESADYYFISGNEV